MGYGKHATYGKQSPLSPCATSSPAVKTAKTCCFLMYVEYLPFPPLSKALLTADTHWRVAVSWWGSVNVSRAVYVLKRTATVENRLKH